MSASANFPRGKLCEDDEGQMSLAIGVQDKTVIINFGATCSWIGFDKDTAIKFGQSIINKANQIAT